MGEYEPIAELLMPAARALADACAISAGQEVLDVAAGNGNLALVAAEEGASVVASDLSPEQVRRGTERLAAEGVDVEWHVADAEELPFADASFDCVASVFGAVFAPRPEVVAAELFRVVRPGNTVGLTAWGRYGPQAEIFEVSRSFSPAPPDDVPLPHLWGDEEIARERLAPHAATIEAERKTMRWQVESPDAAFTLFANNGPGKALSQALSPERVAEWKAALLEVIARHNLADDGSVVYEPEYLQVVARRRG